MSTNPLVKSTATQFLVAFSIILVLKWGTLTQPPVWDSTMGLFPAAITLATNGFDVLGLLQMPGFLEGGPNTHSLSVVTLGTAAVLNTTGGGTTGFVVLHLLHFALAAAALVALLHFAQPVLGLGASAVLCLSVLLFPVFSAQVGHLYFEVPLFLCAILSLLAWSNQRFWPAVLWATLAVWVKEPGIIVPATLAMATLLERRLLAEKLKRVGQVAFPAALLMGTTSFLNRLASAGSEGPVLLPSVETAAGVWHYLDRYLFGVPDLLALIVLFLAGALFLGRPMVSALRVSESGRGAEAGDQAALRVMGYSGLLILSFLLLFLLFLPVATGFTEVLTRYYVVIIPFLLLWLGYGAKRLLVGRVSSPAAVTLSVLCGFFALNSGGAFYPPDIDTDAPGNDPSLTERSNAYRRLLALELEATRHLATLPATAQIYYGHPEHYLFNYPGMGYVDTPLANGHNLFLERLPQDPQALPACLYMLYNYGWLGGELMRVLIQYASEHEEVSTEVIEEFSDGPYKISLIRYRRREADCPV